MKRSIVQSALIAAALLLSASLSLALENKAGSAGETKAISEATATSDKAAKAKKAKAAAKVKPVDINSASKAELRKLPGISDAAADKIIAGRPYLSKANLVTENILPPETYDGLKVLVIAKQNKASAAKLEKLQKERASR
jgi:DNA uptake protein ComE-like DNA-binding protein